MKKILAAIILISSSCIAPKISIYQQGTCYQFISIDQYRQSHNQVYFKNTPTHFFLYFDKDSAFTIFQNEPGNWIDKENQSYTLKVYSSYYTNEMFYNISRNSDGKLLYSCRYYRE